jgi:hypothetical protein
LVTVSAWDSPCMTIWSGKITLHMTVVKGLNRVGGWRRLQGHGGRAGGGGGGREAGPAIAHLWGGGGLGQQVHFKGGGLGQQVHLVVVVGGGAWASKCIWLCGGAWASKHMGLLVPDDMVKVEMHWVACGTL